jgi:hypothetical protein
MKTQINIQPNNRKSNFMNILFIHDLSSHAMPDEIKRTANQLFLEKERKRKGGKEKQKDKDKDK